MYSPSVNGFPLFTISRAATKLAVLVDCGEVIHFLKDSLLSSAFRSSSEIALFRSSSVGYFSANAECLFWKCLSTLHFLLFDIFSPHIKHEGKPASLAMKANEYVHAELNYFLPKLFFFGIFSWLSHCRVRTLQKPPARKGKGPTGSRTPFSIMPTHSTTPHLWGRT